MLAAGFGVEFDVEFVVFGAFAEGGDVDGFGFGVVFVVVVVVVAAVSGIVGASAAAFLFVVVVSIVCHFDLVG